MQQDSGERNDQLTPDWMNGTFWAIIILVYYLLATLLPIDKLIGKLYPAFGGLIIVTAVGITYILIANEGFRLDQTVSYIAGADVVALLLAIYIFALLRKNRSGKA